MKIAGIVAEFNPFHNGHKHLLNAVRNAGYTHIIVVMSGDFVQRGEPAICDKWQRAKAALNNGADLVVELPVSYCLSGAETFAKRSVQILENLGADTIAFGCECDDKDLLIRCAKSAAKYSTSNDVKELTNTGIPYPSAIQKIIEKYEGQDIASILNGANNILAVEYIKNLSDNTDFLPIKRLGTLHDDNKTHGNIASASKIRELLKENNYASDFVPCAYDNFSDFSKLENSIFLKIRSISKDELLCYNDMTDELSDRFVNAIKASTNYSQFLDNVKTKRYTLARIKRICLCILLGITRTDTQSNFEYIRVLGMNDNGKEVLSDLSKDCPYVNTSLSSLSKISDKAKHQANLESNSADIFSFITEKPLPAGSDFKSFPIIL